MNLGAESGRVVLDLREGFGRPTPSRDGRSPSTTDWG